MIIPRKVRGKTRTKGRGIARGGRPRSFASKKTVKGNPKGNPTATILINQIEQRKTKIRERIESMSEDEVRHLLFEILDAQPSLVFSKAAPAIPHGGYHPTNSEAINWCTCSFCRDMPTEVEKLCCGMTPDTCISILPDFEALVLSEMVLAISRFYRNDMLSIHDVDENSNDENKCNKHAAYRQFVLWRYGRLGQGIRVVIPSCCVWKIRDSILGTFLVDSIDFL